MAVAFMLVGYVGGRCIKSLVERELSARIQIISLMVAAITFLICVYLNPGYFYMYIDEYGNYVYAIVGAITGSWAFFVIGNWLYSMMNDRSSSLFGFLNRLVNWYGLNSLVVFPVHLEVLFFVKKVNGALLGGHWIIAFVITILITIIICEFIKRYFPFMIGNLPKKC